MRRRIAAILTFALAALVLAATLAACGGPSPNESEGAEGEPIEVAGLQYNVQITRFLNPDDAEDAEYLVGQPPAAPGTDYLGVFMVINNPSDAPRPSATSYVVTDTLHNEYHPVESQSPYALEVGADVPAKRQIPIADSTAATGPNQGSLLIFPVSEDVSGNRPLRLEIQTYAGSGEVILDI